jgi:prepilin-type N-terminal cleavage/methylation domain-containing protein
MSRRPAFTLVELLVVTAIIAMLISTVFPALVAARAHAVRIRCAANLKNIADALSQYHPAA